MTRRRRLSASNPVREIRRPQLGPRRFLNYGDRAWCVRLRRIWFEYMEHGKVGSRFRACRRPRARPVEKKGQRTEGAAISVSGFGGRRFPGAPTGTARRRFSRARGIMEQVDGRGGWKPSRLTMDKPVRASSKAAESGIPRPDQGLLRHPSLSGRSSPGRKIGHVRGPA